MDQSKPARKRGKLPGRGAMVPAKDMMLAVQGIMANMDAMVKALVMGPLSNEDPFAEQAEPEAEDQEEEAAEPSGTIDEPADVQHGGNNPTANEDTPQPGLKPDPDNTNGTLFLGGSDLYVIDDEDEKSVLFEALMHPDSTMAGVVRKAIDKNVGGGVDRKKLKDSDFVFPSTRTFPIVTSGDVSDAVSSWGRYKGKESFATFKSRLTSLAKRKGFTGSLPDKWDAPESKKKSISEQLLEVGVKSLYDANKSDLVWTGVSHNAWQDDKADIIPLALIEADILRQKKAINAGTAYQYGRGLWIDHNQKAVAGDCTLREVVDGGRHCFEMGNLRAGNEDLNDHKMSIGYNYGKNIKGEYVIIDVYERSGLKSTRRVNGRTFISVKRRNLLQDAAMKSVADELSARLED